jgi:hypothetical protein
MMTIVAWRYKTLTGPFPTVAGTYQNGQSRQDTPGTPIDGAAQILQEQFSYLLEHSGTCTSACRDCIRFRRLAEILLEPFRSEPHHFQQMD